MQRHYLAILSLALIIIFAGCTLRGNGKSCEDYSLFTDWSECINGTQERIRVDFNCLNDSIKLRETEVQECVEPCESNWSCTDWTECSKESEQFRSCRDLAMCENATFPEVNQSCKFQDPCSQISEKNMREECRSIVFNRAEFCLNITNNELVQGCIYSYSYLYSDIASCDLINDSYLRNTCKATISLSKDYCNVLIPENRSSCYYEMDLRKQYLASSIFATNLCSIIENEAVKTNCLRTASPYESYRDDLSYCKSMQFINSSTDYQLARACYIYHIKESGNESICPEVHTLVKNDCFALNANNLTFCYDQSGLQRDWCLANFAYYNDNPSLCREASNENNCYFIAGLWFKSNDFCQLITDTQLKSGCVTSYVSFCDENAHNCPDEDYCANISDANSKNSCILRRVKNEVRYNSKIW
jgi:hypothetical protein